MLCGGWGIIKVFILFENREHSMKYEQIDYIIGRSKKNRNFVDGLQLTNYPIRLKLYRYFLDLFTKKTVQILFRLVYQHKKGRP